jgi:hypothetical protein
MNIKTLTIFITFGLLLLFKEKRWIMIAAVGLKLKHWEMTKILTLYWVKHEQTLNSLTMKMSIS